MSINIDETGYGYSSASWAPLPWQRQDLQRDKFHTSRVIDSMQYIDPYIRNAVDAAVKSQVRQGANAAEVRRAAFGSVSGQVMHDAFTGLRRVGFLGYGDPVNYAANVVQGVAGGGFGLNIASPGGRMVGFGQQVRGNGVLAEQISMNYAKGLLQDLYGKGTPDPAKMYGFDMTESAQIFRQLAQRGALGTVGTLKRNASFAEKLASARQTEVDPMITEGLAGVTEANLQDRITDAKKNGNPKLAKALEDINMAKDALVINEGGRKRVAKIVEETAKGLANLKDVYGELSSPQLMAQMEALTGIQITNSAQAKQAAALTAALRNSAEAAGKDPRQVMDATLMRAQMNQSRFGQLFGLDNRDTSANKELSSRMAITESKFANQLEAAARGTAGRVNTSGGEIPLLNGEELTADIGLMIDTMVTQNPALAYASGLSRGRYKNDPEFAAEYRDITKEFEAASTPRERMQANLRAQRLIEQREGMNFEQFKLTRQGRTALGQMDTDTLAELAIDAGNDATEVLNPDLFGRWTGTDLKTATEASQAVIGGIGVAGLQDFKTDAGGSQKADVIAELLASHVKNRNLSQAESDAISRSLLGENGEIKDMDVFNRVIADLGSSNASHRSRFERQQGADSRVSNFNLDQRSKLADDDGTISLRSIARALITGKSGGLHDEQSVLLGIQALRDEDMGYGLGSTGKIKLTDGLGQDELATLRKSLGDPNWKFHQDLGFRSEEEMLEASKTDAFTREQILERLKTKEGLVVAGTADEMITAGQWQIDKFRSEGFEKKYRAVGALREASGLKGTERNAAMEEIMKTGQLDDSDMINDGDGKFDIDQAYDGTRGWWKRHMDEAWLGTKANVARSVFMLDTAKDAEGKLDQLQKDGKGTIHRKKAGFFLRLSEQASSNPDSLRALNEVSGGDVQSAMETELTELQNARRQGVTTLDTRDKDGNLHKVKLDEAIRQMTEAITALKNNPSGAPVNTGEIHAQVIRVTNIIQE